MSKLSKDIESRIKELAKKKRERDRRRRKSKSLVTAKRRRRKPLPVGTTLRKRPRTYAEAKALYGTAWYKEWRQSVLQRDNFVCQMCGKKGGRLEVHHIRPKYLYPELTLDVNNGITLCKSCHQGRVTKYEERFFFIFDRIVKLNKGK